MSGSHEDQRIVNFLNDSRAGGEARFVARFREAIEAGDLPDTEDPSELAKYLSVVTAGLSVQAAAGASRDALSRAAERALLSFPKGASTEA